MSNQLKLTDEVLVWIAGRLDERNVRMSVQVVYAIRALRDAAEEVALRASESTDPVPPYVQAAIDALAALLPEPKETES